MGHPALTLGLEPIHDNLMKQRPVKRSENILSKSMLTRIGVTGLYMSVVFLLQYTRNFLGATEEQMLTDFYYLYPANTYYSICGGVLRHHPTAERAFPCTGKRMEETQKVRLG